MTSNDSYHQLSEIDKLCINTIRFLSVDAVQKANSGHPGLPMGMAAATYRLFTKHLKFNPKNPAWGNRDRFVLSAGHGSALIYSLLHLCGYDISLTDLKNFRQRGSKTPGHPEYGHTPGIEATTGPLGQGIANSVGMAIAEKYLASHFNKPDFSVVDYNIFTLVGDGCLQEGISSEACSLAGHLGLDNLIVIYDDNQVTIDGKTEISFTEDVLKRFEAYGWYVQEIKGDGHDLDALDKAIANSHAEKNRPSLIKMQSIIGFGSPNKAGTSGVHGSPLGPDEVKLTKQALQWNYEEDFFVPPEVSNQFIDCTSSGEQNEADWKGMMAEYKSKYPDLAYTYETADQLKLPDGWDSDLPVFDKGSKVATRKASGQFLEKVMPKLPLILGGSADLTPSNNTKFSAASVFQKDNPGGRYIHFGVREHAMGAILNGIGLSGLSRAYAGTFLCFADYMLPAIRVAALSGYPSIFVFTHDSIGLGEDGPTHQPVEHISYLRSLPGLLLFRPADANETVEAWRFALENRSGPVAIALTRQGLPLIDQEEANSVQQLKKGAYCVVKVREPDALIIATGSEVSLAIEAHQQLLQESIKTQVVSMPCCELFEAQPETYRNSVIPANVKSRVVVEAGIKRGWEGYMGEKGVFVGMSGFGASAPANELFDQFQISVDSVIEAVKKSKS
jgi:transketolase